MFLYFINPGEDMTAPVRHPGLDHDRFWSMSSTAVEAMIKKVDPMVWENRKTFKRSIWYAENVDEQIQEESGIYHFGWRHRVPDSRRMKTFNIIHLSKDKFDWDSDQGFAIPKSQFTDLYFMTDRGWDWKAKPHYIEDWKRFCEGPPPPPPFVGGHTWTKRARETEPEKPRTHAGTPPWSSDEDSDGEPEKPENVAAGSGERPLTHAGTPPWSEDEDS